MKNILNYLTFNENKKDDNKSFILIFKKVIKENRLEILIDLKNYSFAGGRCEKDETYEDGLLREVEEETGKKFKMCDVKFLEQYKNVKYYYIFVDEDFGDSLKPKSDFKDGGWYKIDKIKDKFTLKLINKAILDKVEEKNINESVDYKNMVSDILNKPNSKRNGMLIVLEGIDGAGKTTQVELLQKYLIDLDYDIEFTKWSSFDLLKKTMKKLKTDKLLDKISYFLLNASDMNLRYVNVIEPAMKKNKIVICDRYYYTSLVRDTLRGIDNKIIETLFKDYMKPDLIFYCKVPIEIAFDRLMNDKGFSYYGSGMDINYSMSIEENCIKYQNEMQKKYTSIFKNEEHVHILDMSQKPESIFDDIKEVLSKDYGIGKY